VRNQHRFAKGRVMVRNVRIPSRFGRADHYDIPPVLRDMVRSALMSGPSKGGQRRVGSTSTKALLAGHGRA
ncbi:MAG: hypothetical protein J4G04_01425, partial [Nitrosopumilaceae archaeon]|nr:hypothetical protein [Nitrosopumilaceae archaeon]